MVRGRRVVAMLAVIVLLSIVAVPAQAHGGLAEVHGVPVEAGAAWDVLLLGLIALAGAGYALGTRRLALRRVRPLEDRAS